MGVVVASFSGIVPRFFIVRGNSTPFYYHIQVTYPHIQIIHKERKRSKKKERLLLLLLSTKYLTILQYPGLGKF